MTRWASREACRFLPDVRRFRWLMLWAQEESEAFCMHQMDDTVLRTFIQDVAPFFHGVPHIEKHIFPSVTVVRHIFAETYRKKHPDYKTKKTWWHVDDYTDTEVEAIICLLEPHFHDEATMSFYLRSYPDLHATLERKHHDAWYEENYMDEEDAE